MRLLALIEQAGHVCYRYRIRAFEPALERNGWTVEARPLPGSPAGFMRILPLAASSDVVVLQRRLLPAWKLSILRRAARVLVYDVDDAVFGRDSNSCKPCSRRRQRRFRATVRAADAVWAGNAFLASQAARFVDVGRIHVVPTCVDPRRYPVARHERRQVGVRIAWIGSRSTLPSLLEVAGALSDAACALPGLELHVVCDAAPGLQGIRTVLRSWSSSTESADLADCDIGLSWLPSHSWSLGKCGLKVLQYLSAGLPVVANRIGVHEHLVADGASGNLVDDRRQCVEAVCRLARSPELRARYGTTGRRRVASTFSVEAWSPRIVNLLQRLTAIDTESGDGYVPRFLSHAGG